MNAPVVSISMINVTVMYIFSATVLLLGLLVIHWACDSSSHHFSFSTGLKVLETIEFHNLFSTSCSPLMMFRSFRFAYFNLRVRVMYGYLWFLLSICTLNIFGSCNAYYQCRSEWQCKPIVWLVSHFHLVGVDAERASDLKILQLVMDIRSRVSLTTHGSGALGEVPPSPFVHGTFERANIKLRNGGNPISSPKQGASVFPSKLPFSPFFPFLDYADA